MQHSLYFALLYAYSQAFSIFLVALVFIYGAYQITQESTHFSYQPLLNIFIPFALIMFRILGLAQTDVYAPDLAKAKLSANWIFHLLDRKPEIDGYSESGCELVSYPWLHTF